MGCQHFEIPPAMAQQQSGQDLKVSPSMSTDNASISNLAHAIGQVAQELRDQGASLNNLQREELVRNAEQLAIAARSPEENLYFQATQVRSLYRSIDGRPRSLLTHPIFQTAQNCAIRTAIMMGIFEKVPHDGTAISAAKIAAASQADHRLVSKYTSN